jgi:hypothetical protein
VKVEGRRLSVEFHIAGPSEHGHGLLKKRSLLRRRTTYRAKTLGVGRVIGPLDSKCSRYSSQTLDLALVRRRQRSKESDAAVKHQLRGRHPTKQRNLRVPPFNRKRAVVDQLIAARSTDDLLRRQVQAYRASLTLELLAQLTNGLEQGEGLIRQASIDASLCFDIRQRFSTADERAFNVDSIGLTIRVEIYLPEDRLAILPRQQARRALAQHLRMQRCPDVRKIQRDAAATCGTGNWIAL